MRIKGWEKLSLIDYPGHVATVIFTGGCNLRCPYCHNTDLMNYNKTCREYEPKEILDFLDTRKGLIDGVVISGGEPASTNGLFQFMRLIKEKGFKIKFDTNGFYPTRLRRLVEEGLIDFIAMDIKNSRDRYLETIGKLSADLDKMEESIDFIMNCGVDYEFRTTVCKEYHEKEDLLSIIERIKGAKNYSLQQYHDSDKNFRRDLNPVDNDIIQSIIHVAQKNIGNVRLRGFDLLK